MNEKGRLETRWAVDEAEGAQGRRRPTGVEPAIRAPD